MTHGEANDWRGYVDRELRERTGGMVRGISPLRCEPIMGERYTAEYSDPRFGSSRAIGSKNLFDTVNCDMVLAYLPKPAERLDTWHQSYGTIAELAWARGKDKPSILVTNDPDISGHPVLNFCANWNLDTLEQGIDVAVGILHGYSGGKNV